MPVVSVVFGLLLIALGVWGRWGGDLGLWEPLGFDPPEKLSGTALIPAYVGAALLVLGLLALKESLLKHSMHLAAMIGLLGLLAALGRLLTTGKVQGVSGASLIGMSLLCAILVALCINSFIQARRRRRAASATPSPSG
ncbi:MAG TPA: hypothetical protein VE999_13505 [Gemmataceae bacterium]|nr:hypothetical protein [Gemmataceae bacterium]